MADNVAITAGAGTTIKTDQGSVTAAHMQVVKLAESADGGEAFIPADAANGLDVDVTRVQGTVSVTAASALPVSATALPLPTGASQEHVTAASSHAARLSDGSAFYDAAKTGQLPTSLVGGRLDVNIGAAGATVPVSDASGSLTVDAPVSAPVFVRLSSGSAAVDTIPVSDAGGNLSVDDGGGSLTVDGTVTANQGTAAAAASAWPTKISDGTDTVGISTVSGAKALKVDVVQQASDPVKVDKAAFTEGTDKVSVAAGVYNETISSDPSEDQAAALRVTSKRGLHVNLRSAAGTEIGASGSPVRTDPTGTTTQPVSGTVTANQGTANSTPWNENLSQVGGTAVVTAAAGIQKVGVVDESGSAFSETNPLPVRSTYPEQTTFKYGVAYTASQTAAALFTPTGGKRYVLCGFIITPTAAGQVKIFDGTDAAANYHYLGTPDGTSPRNSIVVVLTPPMPSSAVNNVLRYSTGSGAAGNITVWGYEA